MPPVGVARGDLGHGQPATAEGDEGRDEEDPSRSSPLPLLLRPDLALIPVRSEKKRKHEEAGEVSFPEDILMEILSRVPYSSLCRFKCVSRSWLALCSDRCVRKRSPQTLSGFFHWNFGWHFQNLSGKGRPVVDPDLSFLRGTYNYFRVQLCSTSLLLCKCWKSSHPIYGWNNTRKGRGQWFSWPEAGQFDYVVCNPATQEWVSLPPIQLGNLSRFSRGKYSLLFGPDFPSRFMVVVPLITYGLPMAMIYSSETRGWLPFRGQGHEDALKTYWFSHSKCTFLNGIMHLSNYLSIVTVDMEGNDWREIKMPPAMKNKYGYPSIGQSQGRLYACVVPFVGQSQGRLYASSIDNQDGCQLSVWILENYATGQWNLKCTVNCLELIGRDSLTEGEYYRTFAIHPDCDLIFLIDNKEKALSYDMTSQKVHVISSSGDFLGVV
ncbi:hypothetical protein VPH35_011224 [Triticum aestivum]